MRFCLRVVCAALLLLTPFASLSQTIGNGVTVGAGVEVGVGPSVIYTLTVTPVGAGSGSVTSLPSGITCGGVCAAGYTSGTVVTLTATAGVGSAFTGWSGGGCSGTGSCVVTMTAGTTVTATFGTATTYSLSVTKSGVGSGTVTSSPSGISCGSTCSANYTSGTAVTLTATPSGGSAFTGWSGGGCSGTGTCVLTLTSNAATTATFGTSTSGISFSPTGGTCTAPCTMTISYSPSSSTTYLFYTTDGSIATEGSQLCGNSGCTVSLTKANCPLTCVVNAVAVNVGTTGVLVQNGQYLSSSGQETCTSGCIFKSVVASTACQSAPYTGSYHTPKIQYCSAAGCNQGVTGIPAGIQVQSRIAVPTVGGDGKTTLFQMKGNNTNTTAGCTGTSHGSGLQLLWPYDTSGNKGPNQSTGCDTCTGQIQDFYAWPQQTSTINPANVQNWELDLNSWNQASTLKPLGYYGSSFQCSINSGGWEYSGQHYPGWTTFKVGGAKITHDCPFPTGVLAASITAGQTSFTTTPNKAASAPEPTMILYLSTGEEILCGSGSASGTCSNATRGWGGTTAASHSSGETYAGSVHVQYHVTFSPGNGACVLGYTTGSYTPTTPVDCIFIDYLNINGTVYDMHSIYGEQTIGGVAHYSKLTTSADVLSGGFPDRMFNQKQIDIAGGVVGTFGEYIDRDNVSGFFEASNHSPYVTDSNNVTITLH